MRVISRHNLRRKAVLEAAALLANEVIQQKNRQRLLDQPRNHEKQVFPSRPQSAQE